MKFQDAKIKMSGENKFAHYFYYELGDILPSINRIAAELKFLCVVSFTDGIGTMRVVDAEKPSDVVEFTTPMASAELKGCHDVQNLGAAQTYLKRYLYQHAFEIVENDAVNGTHNPNKTPEKKPLPPVNKQAPVLTALQQRQKEATELLAKVAPDRKEMWREKCTAAKNNEKDLLNVCLAMDAEIAGEM